MRTEVIEFIGYSKREVWTFDLNVSYKPVLYLENYSFQTKESPRHRLWIRQTHWDRLMKRDNNIPSPPLPKDITQRAINYFVEQIKSVEVET